MSPLAPVLVVDLFPLERRVLLQLLVQLSEEEWHQPTICAGWTVKDAAFQKGTFHGNEMLARKVLDTVSIIA